MRTLIKNANVYHNRRFERTELLLEDGKISRVGDCAGAAFDEAIDAG